MRSRYRGDRAPWQTDDYIDANYEPEEFDHRGQAPDRIQDAVHRAYIAAGIKHPCGRCSGSFWRESDRDRHEGGCSGG